MRGFTMIHTVVLWLSQSLLYWLHSQDVITSQAKLFLVGY